MNYRPTSKRLGFALKSLQHKSDCRWSWTNKQWLTWLRRRERRRRVRQVVVGQLINLRLYGNTKLETRSVDDVTRKQ